jgi:two-component system cell cycle sensor histidine kinase/response regulator CckA
LNGALRVLYVGGEASDEAKLRAPLEASKRTVVLVRADRTAARRTLLESAWNLLLADARPNGISAAEAVEFAGDQLPLVAVVDEGDEQTILDWLDQGATDFIVRPRFERLLPVVIRCERDWAERRRARRWSEELAHSRKLEALGHLAGHIAHDFNNLLSGVAAWASRLTLHSDPVSRECGEQILQAAMRARELTRQVLAFGQVEPSAREPLRLSTLARELVKLLEPSLSKDLRLHVELQAEGTEVLGDSGQLHQAMLNLCTNALQAMDAGGRLTLKVDSVELSQEFARAHPPLLAGPHVRLVVEDTGHGMSPQTLSRIFEPFFTTKPSGMGTGLGLAVVHGVVQAHGGATIVSSTPMEGTTFEVFLPKCAPTEQPPEPHPGNGERLMLVDDQLNLARTSALLLEQLGYRTTVFNDPREALAEFKRDPERFDLVMTDLSMPQMSGFDLAQRLHAVKPALPVILTTGREVSPSERQSLGHHVVLEKPWRVEDAVRAIKRVQRA